MTVGSKEEDLPIAWSRGVPIWQSGDPLPPEGMTLVSICARKAGISLNDAERKSAFRSVKQTTGHAWLEFVDSNGQQSSISAQPGDVCTTDIIDFWNDRDTIRIGYLISASKAEAAKKAALAHASMDYNLLIHNCVHTTHAGASIAGVDCLTTAFKPTYSEDGPAHAYEMLTFPSAVYGQIERKIQELTPLQKITNEVVWLSLAIDDPHHPAVFSPAESFRHEARYLHPSPPLPQRGTFEIS